MSILSLGSEVMNSLSNLAGTVVAPSSSIFAPTQHEIAISRLVAASFKRPSSVEMSTLEVIGRVERTAAARPTTLKPLARFS